MSVVPEAEKLRRMPTAELLAAALAVKLERRKTAFSFCSIINAKSGRCSEDCRYCVQSGHYRTEAPIYPLKSTEEVVAAARVAKADGAARFSLVTSGRGLPVAEVEPVAAAIAAVREQVGIKVCGSFGILDHATLARLKAAGMSRYHHNLETSERFFPQVTTTHTFADRIATIRAAQAAGLEVCAGGIFGLGEEEEDRLSMATTLAELEVDSVPLNILIPLPGTPLEGTSPLPIREILRGIAYCRLLLPRVCVRLAGGREAALDDFLAAAFMAGADGMMIGGYLTQRGRTPAADREFARQMVALWSD
ncbi:biotin synthase BioB [Desulfurivibrio sp. D14AmB]|uniref:biotin synthase BioB n=1 Tax=Desulfurivibrio sp. D14AmB TaxID=3374370 RepID=UPI00376EE543